MDDMEHARNVLLMAAGELRQVPKECRKDFIAALMDALTTAADTGCISDAAWKEYARAAAAVRLKGKGEMLTNALLMACMAAGDILHPSMDEVPQAEHAKVLPFRR